MAKPMFGSLGTTVGARLADLGRKLWDEAPADDRPALSMGGTEFSAWLPWRHYEPKYGLYIQSRRDPGKPDTEKKSGLGFVLEVLPLLGGSDSMQRILTEMFNEGLPDGAKCQIIQWASPKVGPLLDAWAAERAKRGGVYAELARHRREMFRRGAWTSLSSKADFIVRDFRIFVSVEVNGATDENAMRKLATVRDRFVSSFATLGTHARDVEPQQLIAIAQDLLNPSTSILATAPNYDPEVEINRQCINWDTRINVFPDRLVFKTRAAGDGFAEDDWQRERDARSEAFEIRGLACRQFPDHSNQGQMANAIGHLFNEQLRLPGPAIATFVFSLQTMEQTRAATEFKRARTQQTVDRGAARLFPSMQKSAEDWAQVADDVSDGARLAHVGFFVLSMSKAGDGDRAESAVRSVYRSARFSLERHDLVQHQTLMACLPLGFGGAMDEDLKGLGRLRRMPTTVAAKLAPLQGEYCSTRLPHMLLTGRRGQLTYWSPFENEGDGNHNVTVVGSSGSGKSVFMQEMSTSLAGAGCLVVVIDSGQSFKNVCKLQGGSWIRFNMQLDVCINPFSMADHESKDDEYIADAKKDIRILVMQMARGDAGGTDEESGLVESIVHEVWTTKKATGSIDDVVDLLKSRGGTRGENLALSLTSFTSTGVYGKFFNGPATLEIQSAYTVFEMQDLDSKPDLRSVVVLQILSLVREVMRRGGRQQRKALIIDEAWSLLGDGPAGEFIEGFVRRCRKEGGALITGTQSIDDYFRTEGARACFENSDWSVILRLKPEVVEQVRKNDRLAADAATLEVLKSLRMEPGVFAEMVIKGSSQRFLARLVLDPYSGTLYSTKPEVLGAIEALVAQGLPTHEAVRRVAFGENSPLMIEQQLRAEVEEMIARDHAFGELMNGYADLGARERTQIVNVMRRLRREEAA
jgi:conjugal transfer ATP-binding protein TraC